MQYLIDTNIVSEIMRREPSEAVMSWFSRLDEINLSTITMDEVIYGLDRKMLVNKKAWFNQFCRDRATLFDVSEEIALWSGEKRAELEGRGVQVTMADSLIAGTAHHYGLVLSTRNTKDFIHMGIALFNPFSD